MKVRSYWLTLLFVGSSIVSVSPNNSTGESTTTTTLQSTRDEYFSTTIPTILRRTHSYTLSPSSSSSSSSSSISRYTNHYFNPKKPSGLATSADQLAISRNAREIVMNNYVMKESCYPFVHDDPKSPGTFYNPGHPEDYPNNTDCVRVLEAPPGQMLRLDFREKFTMEPSEDCKFDFLEIRDGPHGYSKLKGKYCGHEFPPMIYSKERHLWLRFHSDENIEYRGFTAVWDTLDRPTTSVPEDIQCRIEISGNEGFVNRSDVPADIEALVVQHQIPLDCMWVITVKEGWKIQVRFTQFKLHKPNECEHNFLDIFGERTDDTSRMKNFCGSIAETTNSKTNIMHLRFYATPTAFESTFSGLFTAFRETGSGPCAEDEYDCQDATCISGELKCNGQVNCRFRWDEDECKSNEAKQEENITIIIVVFGLILGGMMVTFLVNCMRRLIRDQKIIREHIRQSKESRLDEVGRASAKRSRENLSVKLSPREKHSQCSLHILDDVSSRYYREIMPISVHNSRTDMKSDNIIKSKQDIVIQTNLGDEPLNASDKSGMCDMGCQTRESLFQPVVHQKSISSSSPVPSTAIRFSTFGYDAPPSHPHTLSRQASISKDKSVGVGTAIELEDFSQLQSPSAPYNICEHQQQCELHQAHTPQCELHPHQSQGKPSSQKFGRGHAPAVSKAKPKVDESKVFIDIRNSAPDVIIMTSH